MTKMPEDAARYNAQAVIELATRFRAEVDESSSLSELEARVLALANAVVRAALADVMQDRAGFAEFLSIGEKLYRRHQPGRAKYHSLSGPIEIERWTYRLVGARNGPTIIPFELREGILENATPALGYACTGICEGADSQRPCRFESGTSLATFARNVGANGEALRRSRKSGDHTD